MLSLNLGQVFLVFILFYKNVCAASGDYFSSIVGMEELLKTEVILLNELQDYVDSLSQHVDILKSEVELIRNEHLDASKDLEGYLSNPINAYRLIKRLSSDWMTYEANVQQSESKEKFLQALKLHQHNHSFPTEQDVVGAAVGLVRLQDTYKLDVAQVASGFLNGIKYGPAMSWQDCFFMGHYLYAARDFNNTIPWLQQSMKLLSLKEYKTDENSLDFMEAVVGYHQEMGDFENALSLLQEIMALDPWREGLGETKAYLEQMLTKGQREGLLYQTYESTEPYYQTAEYYQYEQVCREELTQSASQKRALRCRYHTNNIPYRLIQPYKLEEYNLEPYIVQIHDVLNEADVLKIKQLAKPQMSRSRVFNSDGTKLPTHFRTSQNAWLFYEDVSDIHKLRQHVGDISGLSVKSIHAVEPMQVANYGIGGQYDPHWDFFKADVPFDEASAGNRVATAIFYLTDVEEGGGTAFPFLSVLVKPIKGSALFWYNLHQSGDRDYRTKHAGCPVLKGSKWIANVWVRYNEQMLARQCGLQRDHESSLMYEDEL